MTTTIPRHLWCTRLEDFTNRNAGRRAVLEVDDLDLGAQAAVDYPLWGISYDPVGDRVEVMFSDFRDLRSHLTHAIPRARSIELMRDQGKDEVLRILGERGEQTLLRLLSPVAGVPAI
ncbi:MAG TPA: DUF5335 family protein [Gemmatimonadota bacterium]|jgi:hypothetical protein